MSAESCWLHLVVIVAPRRGHSEATVGSSRNCVWLILVLFRDHVRFSSCSHSGAMLSHSEVILWLFCAILKSFQCQSGISRGHSVSLWYHSAYIRVPSQVVAVASNRCR